ncbi:MAG: InlB B-repeat-containing protein [Paludibacteraceae bacterium]|nr:InlB B-repeat-containing protein [Paludibacteraceae bacterium]
MKNLFTLFTLVALFASATMAQVKLYVHQNDGSYTEFVAATVDSITFSENSIPTDPSSNGYQYVDMGLPSGLLWATCNLGTNKSTEFGDYFAWGETETKESYTNKTYKWYEDSDEIVEIKYSDLFKADASGNIRTLLELEDDAANVKLGGNWRMPTREEFEELLHPANTDLCLVSKNDVKGYLVVSKKNGNTLFLPAAGFKLADEVTGVEDEYYYWTSEHAEEGLGVANVVGNFYGSLDVMPFFNRPIGCTIRPVLAKTLDYTISFNANGAEGEMADVDAKYAQTITLPTCTFTKEEEVFKGWNTEPNGTGTSYKENQVLTITEDLTLYAIWRSKQGYVDLGLPSGLLWASCNIGAENPEEFGDYFAWGEVEPKERYEYDNYVGNATGKYNINQYMELVDDAARHNLGGNWRIPLPEEMDELVNECTWTWTTLNNVNGYEVKGPNGNTIFLPAAGEFYSKPYDQGEDAVYRGNYKRGQTFNLHFYEGRVYTMVEMHEYSGFTIRPVRNKTAETYTLTFNANGGEGEMESLSFEYAEYKTLPFSTFTKEGSVCSSWNTKADGTGFVYMPDKQIALTDNTTLYAMWTEYTSSESNEYVDLGLSVKWATCNVGADSPYEYGENYAWGEVETKDSYEWSNYKWCNGTSTSITKYCIASYYGKVDNKTTLELSDDAASVNLGGNWRIPTTAEVEELMSECEWIWQNAGYLVVSKVNGKSIFIPSAEYCAKYWTSDMSDYSNLSDILYVSPSGYEKTYDERKKGLLIRPVLP